MILNQWMIRLKWGKGTFFQGGARTPSAYYHMDRVENEL